MPSIDSSTASSRKNSETAIENTHEKGKRLRRLAWFLDDAIPLPGGYRVGADGFIGIIPGIGDVAGAVLSTYILREAALIGVPKSTLLHMAYNIAIESVVGLIPIVGDIFDFAWKSNQRNIKLLNAYLDSPRDSTKSSRLFVFGMTAGVIAFIVGIGALGIMILRWVFQLVVG